MDENKKLNDEELKDVSGGEGSRSAKKFKYGDYVRYSGAYSGNWGVVLDFSEYRDNELYYLTAFLGGRKRLWYPEGKLTLTNSDPNSNCYSVK